MSLQRKLKTALDETRLLILGAQVLFGFQFNGVFQEGFGELPAHARMLSAGAMMLMALSIGLLIAPSMQHRLVERGEATKRIHTVTTAFAGAALLPLALSLGLDTFIVFERMFGARAGLAAGIALSAVALLAWYGIELALKPWTPPMAETQEHGPTPLSAKIEQMLTEARLIIPGAQALLGFQLTVTLTKVFEQLPPQTKVVHAAALCCVALAVVLLMTPAAIHRISFGGEDALEFLKIGSAFVVAATVPLAAGIALDLYVALDKSLQRPATALALAGMAALVLAVLWYLYPLALRARGGRR